MFKGKKWRSTPKWVIVLGSIGIGTAPAFGLTSFDNGSDIGQLIGANTFYSNGYTGSGAIVANIEGGYVWNGQQTLTNVTTQLHDASITGQFDMHATWVGSAIAGKGSTTEQKGIAYGAALWTGAIADYWNSQSSGAYSLSFHYTTASFTTPYLEALITGVNGQTADVINSSFAGTNDQNGLDPWSVVIDSLTNKSGKLVIFAAGNAGSTTNTDTIYSPASGTNTLDVGALTSDTSSPAYCSVASFSSRSPSDFFVPTDSSGSTGTALTGVRARVDITAPGTDLVLAHYGGATGGNAFGATTDFSTVGFDNEFDGSPLGGTSFAAPIVAGGAALIVDVGKTLYSSDTHATDGRVLKAVLMNSADKPAGWNNGQSPVGGVVTTTQSLDYTYGAGILDLSSAYKQYTSGTHDVSSLTGGNVQSTGWAYGRITHVSGGTARNDYTVTTPLTAGNTLNATLDWYSDETTTASGLNPSYGSFDNLDLRVYLLGGSSPTLVAQSDSLYNSVQQLSFALPTTGSYMIEVLENNYLWNFVGDTATNYGLAWSVAVPEPAVASMIILGSTTMLMRRRRAASVGSGLAA